MLRWLQSCCPQGRTRSQRLKEKGNARKARAKKGTYREGPARPGIWKPVKGKGKGSERKTCASRTFKGSVLISETLESPGKSSASTGPGKSSASTDSVDAMKRPAAAVAGKDID